MFLDDNEQCCTAVGTWLEAHQAQSMEMPSNRKMEYSSHENLASVQI